jgi:hypothetical protein
MGAIQTKQNSPLLCTISRLRHAEKLGYLMVVGWLEDGESCGVTFCNISLLAQASKTVTLPLTVRSILFTQHADAQTLILGVLLGASSSNDDAQITLVRNL